MPAATGNQRRYPASRIPMSSGIIHISNIPSPSLRRVDFTLPPPAMPQELFTKRLTGYTPYQWAMAVEPPLVIPPDNTLQVALQALESALPSHIQGFARESGYRKPKTKGKKGIFCPYLKNKGSCKFLGKSCVFSHDRRLLQKTQPVAVSSGSVSGLASIRAPAHDITSFPNKENILPNITGPQGAKIAPGVISWVAPFRLV
ncbi:hypothetical protein TWF506_002657 [Arthrobotrys conoides]|uniref:C3H1-type domain-containing protein n=1 Tax=Arthrobotrys conoides TaxID=74498 RepID=A0AAN8RUZ9_9PEZI